MTLYELFSTFEAFATRQKKKKFGEEVSDEEYDDMIDNLVALNNPTIAVH